MVPLMPFDSEGWKDLDDAPAPHYRRGRPRLTAPDRHGSGWYQEEGHDAVSLEPGAVVFTRAGVKHWHGAKSDSWFSHIALGVPGENSSNEWLHPVDDVHYDALDEGRR